MEYNMNWYLKKRDNLKDIEISWKDKLWRRMEWKEPDWHFIMKFIFILDVSHDHTKINI